MHSKRTRRIGIGVVACAAAALVMASPSSAAIWDWTGGATEVDPVTGNWNDADHWAQGTIPASANDTVLDFQSGTAGYTSTNDLGAFTLNRINFSAGDGTENVTVAGGTLNFDGAGAGIYSDGAAQTSVNSAINADTLILSSGQLNSNLRLNVSSGNIDVTELRIAAGGATIQNTHNNIGQITVEDGARLRSLGSSTTAVVHFEGDGAVTKGGNQAFTTGGWQSEAAGAGRIAQDGTIGTGAWTINVAAGQTYEFSGIIGSVPGTGANDRTHFIKTGAGTQIISGNMVAPGNNNRAQITVNEGLLVIASTSTVAGQTGTGTRWVEINNNGTLQVDGILDNTLSDRHVELNTGGTLTGSGEIRRNVDVAAGGIFSPGSSIGTLTIGEEDGIARTLTLNDAFQLVWEYDNGLSDRDLVRVFGELDLTDALTGTVNLVDLGTGDLQEGDVLISTTGGILGASNISGWTLNGGGGLVLGVSGDGNNLILIPEPASLALMGVGALLMLRRRKSA
ncbi:MAG: PEP-CTERM sorting domain-containing protein [Phycisphaeraceae bacterium]|nr:PEP-CTERM sorting domain-containing protein [Phycisphaeraceae bacterium]